MAENTSGQEKKSPFYKKWWFWVIVVLFIYGFWSGMNGDDSEITEVDKNSILSEQEEDSIVFWEGTSGEELFDAVCEELGADEANTAYGEGENYEVYTVYNDVYDVYIEADQENDEIHYVKIDITEWDALEEDQEKVDFFVEITDLLGLDTEGFDEEVYNFLDQANEYSAVYENAYIVMYYEDGDDPICEIMAQ